MLCQICQEREATIHLKQTRQGKTTEYHLCELCASEQNLGQQMKGYLNQMFGHTPLSVGNIFIPAGGIPEFGQGGSRQLTCPNCGLSYEEFRKTGLFGCSQCYEAFSERLDPVFRRVQGNIRHHGKKRAAHSSETTDDTPRGQQSPEAAETVPGSSEATQIDKLRQQLKAAVEQEDYETAARLRDQIHMLEETRDQTKEGRA